MALFGSMKACAVLYLVYVANGSTNICIRVIVAFIQMNGSNNVTK